MGVYYNIDGADKGVDMVVWIVALIAIAAAFVTLSGFVLPRLLFYTKYDVNGSSDRGIKKVDYDEGSVVFEPSPEVKKFISGYALSVRDGKRVLVCKLAQKLAYIDYDVIVFDKDDKVLRVFNIKENVTDGEYTRVVELPDVTEYVSLMINEADGQTFKHKVVKNVSAGRVCAFIACTAALIAAAVFGIKICCAYLFAGLFRESFIVLGKSNTVTAIIAAIAVVIDIIFTVIAFAVRRATTKGGKYGGR